MTGSTPEHVLEMRGIRKEFPGVVALDDVDLRLRPGSIHALVGENGAGKSTLMNCLFGLVAPDAGTIVLAGEEVAFASPREALDAGISMIQQELHPIPARSVMENIWLGRFPTRGRGPLRVVDHDRMRERTRRLFRDFGIDIRPDAIAGLLSVSQVQLMEIARALSYSAKVVILDEPTSSLSEHEVGRLFAMIRRLRDQGTAIVYISHKMEEIREISDEVSIMRDGHMIGTWPTRELSIDQIITRMVGRELSQRFPEKQHRPGGPILEVRELTSAIPGSFRDVTFDLRAGEVLGIGGLVGAQRTELVESIFGLRPIGSGEIAIGGAPVTIRTPLDAKRSRIALLTEDRRLSGVVPTRSVYENVILANLRQYANALGIVDSRRAARAAGQGTTRLRVRAPSLRTPITSLSGGNQQKVLFARWLLSEPDILILDEPTRGIDVGAKFEIYTIINELAALGKGIIMISSEMPELLGASDRIVVMCRGRVTGIVDARTADQTTIMRLATNVAAVADADAADAAEVAVHG
jgi:methyl-galactoside transport system ATP-binding protein